MKIVIISSVGSIQKRVPAAKPRKIRVVLNWYEEFRDRE